MLHRLDLHHFRIYRDTQWCPGPGINVVLGDNGSGKSSLLEAIYLIGTGRSFRTARLPRLVQDGQEEATLFAEIGGASASRDGMRHSVGMARSRTGFTALRLDGAPVRGLSELAQLLPVQVFHPGTVEMLEGGAGERRRFLDWGLFHVEQSFLPLWRQFSQALQQRNRLLRAGGSERELKPWTQQVAAFSVSIDRLRRDYLERLQPRLEATLAGLGQLPEIRLALFSGWAEKDADALEQLLFQDLERERQMGHTTRGAHRADLRFTCDGVPVRDVLSRGQLKTLSYALLISQLSLMVQDYGRHCVLLVDDLCSELDTAHSRAILTVLASLNQQMIITALQREQLSHLEDIVQSAKMFHVEHGRISALP